MEIEILIDDWLSPGLRAIIRMLHFPTRRLVHRESVTAQNLLYYRFHVNFVSSGPLFSRSHKTMPAKRSKYDMESLQKAVVSVRNGEMSLRAASRYYGVPVMTIQDRVKGRVDDGASAGRPSVLPLEVENRLVEKLKIAAQQGFGLTRRMLQVRVARLVRSLKIKTPFRNGVPGKDWLAGFLARHPDLTIRKPSALSTVRARMLNPTVTGKYFNELGNILEMLKLSNQPKKIWNIDETSVPLLHKPARVIASTGAKNVPCRVGNNRENISVLACINADGNSIPPMVIVKGKTPKSLNAYNTKEGVPGAVYTFQEKAWMEDTLGQLWFQNHFLKHCGPERPQLIILDSHSSHESLGLIDAARDENITLLTFPPHTTQWLCPLDKSVFGPLSRAYSRVCTEFMSESPNNIVTKWEWPRLFKNTYQSCFTISNIQSGFRKCGISPFNPSAIPNEALAPSEPFNISLPESLSEAEVLPRDSAQIASPPSIASLSVENLVDESISESPQSIPESPQPSTSYVEPAQTLANFEVLTETEVLESILSGDLPLAQDPEGDFFVQVPCASIVNNSDTNTNAVSTPTANWSEAIDNIFDLEQPVRQNTTAKPNSRKLTSHRILTSDEIYGKKVQEAQKKKADIERKEQRKIERETKKQAKKDTGKK
ncbi:hypothetical protein ScPMuIL_012446 [Solemya velum]